MDEARAVALQSAITFHAAVDDLGLRVGVDAADTLADDQTAVLNTAEVFLAWLRGPASVRLIPGPAFNQSTGLPSGTPTEGDPVQIHDNDWFTLAFNEKDSKGFATSDPEPVTWTSSDETVVPLSGVFGSATAGPSADTLSFTVVGGNPGSAVVTATLTLASGTVLTVTEAVDVVPGGVATVSLTEGPVSVQ